MTLESVTSSFVIDYSELTNEIYQTVLKNEERGNGRLQRDASDLVYDMIDDYITQQLYWARPKRPSADSYDFQKYEHHGVNRRVKRQHYTAQTFRGTNIYEKYRDLLRNVKNRSDLVERISDKMADLVLNHIELPTWRIIHLTRHRSSVLVEVGEDFRVEEWMKENGHKYGF